jgi:tetratricopeptide (TPR) repeat protein
MGATLTPNEAAQLSQTIEMFEVITQSQPEDYQSLEILKEAYFKLGRQKDVVNTSKRIAQAYVNSGQLSSAILEYESILQHYPDDPDVKAALQDIENKASNLGRAAGDGEAGLLEPASAAAPPLAPEEQPPLPKDVDDGRSAMHKLFVEDKLITEAEFNQYWPKVDAVAGADRIVEPFLQVLADRGVMPLSKSLKLLSERTRLGFLPLDKYDVDVELTRTFPREVCRRWCVLPFDRLSKSVLVATANPFNKQAALELERATRARLLWYLSSPADLVQALRRVFR